MSLQANLWGSVVMRAARMALFWIPVFVLYFSSVLPPSQVLTLEAIYFFCVVVLEVPSGYLSDRFGRRPTLLVASIAWAAGSLVLALAGSSFALFVLGQVLLAVGMSFQSGTDSSLLYDTLAQLGRRTEFLVWEARAQTAGLASLAVAALIGGFAGDVDLRLGHALSGIAGIGAVIAVLFMVEPDVEERAPAGLEQVRALWRHSSHPVLRYTLAVDVALVVLSHVPYELMQIWLDQWTAGLELELSTPIVSGFVTSAIALVAAVASRSSAGVARRLGPATTILLAFVLLNVVLAGMVAGPHPLLIGVLLLRSVPGALVRPVQGALTHEVLTSGQRATWLSVQSLVGRLGFSTLLFAMGAAVGREAEWTPALLQELLLPTLVLGVITALALFVLAPRAARA